MTVSGASEARPAKPAAALTREQRKAIAEALSRGVETEWPTSPGLDLWKARAFALKLAGEAK